jgi:selenium metabolism protein YedF
MGKVILVQGDTLGRGDETVGTLLMANFLRLLGSSDKKPEKLILWNTGVRLVCEGSRVLEYIKELEQKGVEILACTTCLEYFDLKDKQLVGKPSTMAKSIEAMMNHEVVSL